ncbi:hypothetical protein EGM_06867 [Macaca fascicularis]|uniref:Uncharacterized protein n=1 Tax=Macaca fascicularis TaxID=9541 RepID=G7PS05_MACFA|nr:hypothetical protein EGM_06867 [Macaca fascicularis]
MGRWGTGTPSGWNATPVRERSPLGKYLAKETEREITETQFTDDCLGAVMSPSPEGVGQLRSANLGGDCGGSRGVLTARRQGPDAGAAPKRQDYNSQDAAGQAASRLRRCGWQLRPLPGGGAAGSVLSGRRQRAGWVWAGFGDICGLGWGRLSPWLVRVGSRDPNPRLLQSKALTSTWRDAEPSSEAPQPSEPHITLPVVPRIRCPPPKPPSFPRRPSYLPLTATWASLGEAQDGVLRGPGTQGHLWRV